jgi:hypothetical protein
MVGSVAERSGGHLQALWKILIGKGGSEIPGRDAADGDWEEDAYDYRMAEVSAILNWPVDAFYFIYIICKYFIMIE